MSLRESPLPVVAVGDRDRERWDHFVGHQHTGNLLQSWGWGELRRHYGWKVDRSAVLNPATGAWTGTLQILEQRLPGRLLGWAYAPQGPVLADLDDTSACRSLLRAAEGRLRRRGVLQLKCDPEWTADSATAAQLRRDCGLLPARFDVQQRHSWLVDLPEDSGDLLAGLPASTRRNVRAAERQGVEVQQERGDQAVAHFYSLNVQTLSRQRLSIRPLSYYQLAARELGAEVFIARYQDQPLAAAVALVLGRRLIYLYGGTSKDQPQVRASYALHHAIMNWGIGRGCQVYDMWGMPRRFDPSNPEHGYAVFKTRWGGRMADYGGLLIAPMLGPADPLVHRLEAWLLRRHPLLR